MLSTIKEQLKDSMFKKNKKRINALRNILAKVKMKEIEKNGELTSEEFQKVLQTMAKQLKDSIQQFKDGGRDDLVEKESYELKIISQFLPEQLSKEEIDIIVQKIITDLKATSMSDMGMVIKKTMEITKGSADGKLISELARNYLK